MNEFNYCYSSLGRDRIIFVSEDITKELSSTLCSLLLYYNAMNPTEEITLLIHTNGGDVAALSSIYDVMSLIQAPISTVGIGKVYSAGAFILAAGTKGRRFIYKNAEVMIHGLQCSFPENPVSDQLDSEIYFNYLDSLNKRIIKILSRHTGQTVSKIENDSKRDLYLNASEAVKYGLVDDIIS